MYCVKNTTCVPVCVCVCTCSTSHHVKERVDRLHQLRLLSLQGGVVGAGDSQPPL